MERMPVLLCRAGGRETGRFYEIVDEACVGEEIRGQRLCGSGSESFGNVEVKLLLRLYLCLLTWVQQPKNQ
jgi:hypothetical protein